ncbi:MAG: hypothetical protein AAGA66_21235 [Bacteroidota bacterium]
MKRCQLLLECVPYAEWINKGRQQSLVEIGKGLTITTINTTSS